MKKTLIALAAIAAVGSASAQWTVGGKLDVGMVQVAGDSNPDQTATKNKDFRLVSGGWEASRIVLKGDTDLGSGLKGSAYLEGRVGDDLNTASFSGFGRQAFVSVAGSFGKIDAGTMWSPIDTAVYYADAMEYNGFTVMNNGFWNSDTGNGNAAGAVAGAIQYTSPEMSGITVQLMAAPNSGTADYQKYMSGGINYANGPLLINAAMQTYKTAASKTSTSTVIAAQYNMGAATLIGGYASNDTGTVTESGFNVGVKVPMGADYIAAAYSSYDRGTVAGGTMTGFGLNYIKPLGKTTLGYLGYKSVNAQKYDKKGTDTITTTGAGLRYNF